MHETNPGSPSDDTPSVPPPLTSGGPAAIEPPDGSAIGAPAAPAHDLVEPPAGPPVPEGPPILTGLRIWLVLIGVLGIIGIVVGQAELALMATLAGAFAAAHAADRDPIYRPLHLMLTGVLVAGCAVAFAALAAWLATQSGSGPLRPLAVGISGGAAVLSVLTAWRPLSDGMASAVFRTLHPNHVTRLGGRLVLMVLLFMIPGWAAFPTVFDLVAERGTPLLDDGELVSSLIGLIVLSLGGVGFMVRRDFRASLERLGLRAPVPSHYVVVVVGVLALYLLNLGVEWIERTFFPELWRHDDRINGLLAGGLGIPSMMLLGLSAGVGEELAMRGALQPRLGLVFTAVVFASLHVHYSWIGMATILLLGILLGVIRDRTSTTVAILVHALYDFLAVVTNGGAGGR